MEDWYKVRNEDLNAAGGGRLLKHMGSSLGKALESIYPDHRWHPWRFSKVGKGFWEDPKNVRDYVEWLGEKLQVKALEDWYKITSFDRKNSETFHSWMLKSAYPEHDWQVWRFDQVPKQYWNEETQRQCMDWLEQQLGISKREDWNSVQGKDIIAKGGASLLRLFKYNVKAMVQELRP